MNALANAHFTRRLGGNCGRFLLFGYVRLRRAHHRLHPDSQLFADVHGGGLTQFEKEIAFFNANTDGLIVDEMRNPGGNLCYGESIAARLIPDYFRATGFRLRPFWSRILGFYNSWINAKATGAPQQVIDQYELLFKAMLAANTQGQTITDSLPLCTSSLDRARLWTSMATSSPIRSRS